LPSALHYFAGTRTEELWMEDPHVDWGYPLHGSVPHFAVLNAFVENGGEQYDLVVNIEDNPWAKSFTAVISGASTLVCGPCMGADGRRDLPFEDNDHGRLWADRNWIAEDLTHTYPFLTTGFIGEIFCRLAYLTGTIPSYSMPSHQTSEEVPEVLISTAASIPEKLWPLQKWSEVLVRLRDAGFSVGLIGAKPTAQSIFWQGGESEDVLVQRGLVRDLRGRFRLPEVIGALGKAQAVLTIDNGILHLAAAAGSSTVGLFRHGIHRLWAPPSENLAVLTPGEAKAVSAIELDQVWEALRRAL
jgi:heptosyltransferase III